MLVAITIAMVLAKTGQTGKNAYPTSAAFVRLESLTY